MFRGSLAKIFRGDNAHDIAKRDQQNAPDLVGDIIHFLVYFASWLHLWFWLAPSLLVASIAMAHSPEMSYRFIWVIPAFFRISTSGSLTALIASFGLSHSQSMVSRLEWFIPTRYFHPMRWFILCIGRILCFDSFRLCATSLAMTHSVRMANPQSWLLFIQSPWQLNDFDSLVTRWPLIPFDSFIYTVSSFDLNHSFGTVASCSVIHSSILISQRSWLLHSLGRLN